MYCIQFIFVHILQNIPDEFVIKYGADLRDVVFLEVPTGAIWKVELLQNSNGTKYLNNGWNQFKEYYSIAIGYFLLFQYNGNSHFSVCIFDLSASEIEYLSGPNEHEPPVSRPNCLAERHREKPDVGEDLTYATQKRKKSKRNGMTTVLIFVPKQHSFVRIITLRWMSFFYASSFWQGTPMK